MSQKLFSPITQIIKDAKKGKMFIIVDDKDRENEGDLVMPGSKCTSKNINFMAKHGRGLICLALTKEKVNKLGLPLMSSINKARMQTAFTVSIEARKGITTGISAFDRSKTIKTAINPNSKKKDIVSPGHVFPLIAKNGGVLERAGHTEASVDISKLSKLNPSAVICEVMNEDGRMARLKDLIKFAKKHKLKITSIEKLISHRLKNEKFIYKLAKKKISIRSVGKLELNTFSNSLDSSKSFSISRGKIINNKSIRVRVISLKYKNDHIRFSNSLIKRTLKYLNKYNNFVLIIVKDQKESEKTSNFLRSNNTLRYYGIGAQIIKELKIKNMILVTRSKKKIIGLDGFGIKITKQEIIK